MDKMIKFIGKDKHGRKVFQGESGRLYCDVAMTHRFGGESEFYTKLNNDFDGEPDMPTPKEWNPQIIESKNKGKQLCRLTESDLHKIVKESVNKILKGNTSEELRVLLKRAFSNLNDEERGFLFDMINSDTWYTVYVIMSVLKQSATIKLP